MRILFGASVVMAAVASGCAIAPPTTPVDALRPYYAQADFELPRNSENLSLDVTAPITRLAIGSCLQQRNPAPILDAVTASGAQAFVYMGDNVYGDADAGDMTLPELREAYATLAAREDFQALSATMPIVPTWDDHDYGMNDGDARFSAKEFAEDIFLEFWRIPVEDPRRARPGIYSAFQAGPDGQTVQVIVLDTRYFRDVLTRREWGRGYTPDETPEKTMLGDAQWAWLAEELDKPADLRVLVSSVQIIADGHYWEAWRMLPAERKRLYAMLDEKEINNIVFLSGDRHRGGLYKHERGEDFRPIYELTSSSLNLPVSAWGGEEEPGPFRVGPTYLEENFGLVDIDWEAQTVTLSLRDIDGDAVMSQTTSFAP